MPKRGGSSNVQVFARVRPLNEKEQRDRCASCVVVDKDEGGTVNVSDGSSKQTFSFEKVFDHGANQADVYRSVASPLVSELLAGHDCCLMAYGEVGSGKTHTMFGRVKPGGSDDDDDENDLDDDVSSLGSTGASEARPSRRRGSADSSKKNLPPPSSVYAGKSYHPPLHPSFSRSGSRAQVPGQLLTPQQKMFGGRGKERASVDGLKDSNGAATEDDGARKVHLPEEAGIVPRAVSEIFAFVSKKGRCRDRGDRGSKRLEVNSADSDADISITCSYVAVYFENIIDLLAEQDDEKVVPPPETRRLSRTPSLKSLSVKEDPKTGKIFIDGDIEHACSGEEKAFALLEKGNKFRHSTLSRMSIDLSRSHTIFSISVQQSGGVKSRFDFVDLAGNQSVTKRSSKSLAALENVVYALSESHDAHVPYRDSTLTKAMREHLGGNSCTHILVTVNPSSHSSGETVSTMRFGQRAKRIVNKRSRGDAEKDGGADRANRLSRGAGVLESAGRGDGKERVTSSVGGTSNVTGGEGRSARSSGGTSRDVTDSGQSAQLSAKRMEDDLALAREELTTVSSLLRTAAKRMEADLTMAKEELSAPAPFGTMAQQIEADLRAAKDELSLQPKSSQQQPLHLTARQIELDLEAARRELMGVASELEEDRKETSTPGTATDLTGSSGVGVYGRDAGVTALELKKKDQLLAAMEREISALRKENDALNRVKNTREEELSRARKDIQVLTLRATDAESNLAKLWNDEGSTSVENGEVSNIVGSHTQPKPFVKLRGPVVDENAIDVGTEEYPNGLNIRVCLRLRPMSKLETSRRSRSCFEIHECSRNFTVDSHLDGEYDFCYDQVFDTGTSQSVLYDETGRHAVSDLLSGLNRAVMVYGLSSTGKTHTLMGSLPDISLRDNEYRDSLQDDAVEDESAGIAPRTIKDLFKGMEKCAATTEFTIRCSFVSVYLEKIFDLLQPQAKKSLFVRESPKGIEIEGATEALCYDKSDIFALLQRGKACLSVLATRMNMDTNRSHSIFTIKVEQRNLETGARKYSQLLLAELTCFEMSGRGKGQTMQETKIAHKSFSSLGNVLKALSHNKSHAPYRDSKLTCVLKDALGGNCKSTLIITASPSSYTISETLNAVRLGQRVRRIVNWPHVNWDVDADDYKKWLMSTEIQLGELVAFVKDLAGELRSRGEENAVSASKVLAGELWKSINAIVEREEKLNNPCREAFSLGDFDALKDCGLKWKALSTDLLQQIPSDELSAITLSRDKAQSLLSDIRSEIVVLRRQNELLVADKRKKMEELASSKKDMKLLTLRIAELEHNLGLSDYRSKQAMSFLQHLRKLCWSLRKDVSEGRTLAIEEVTSCISETPDLSGLVDLDSLMLEMGLIDTLDLNDDDDDLPNSSTPRETSDLNAAQASSGRPALHTLDARDTEGNGIGDDRRGTNNSQNPFRSSFMNTLLNKNAEEDANAGETAPLQGTRSDSHTERELRRDLRKMTNKCVDLQLQLNEEKTNVDILTNRSGIKHKQLAQEVMTLRKEKDRMMQNAKTALWKLQELHLVNRVLSNKSTESSAHVAFLEEGFQRLQETFRTTVLDSLDADSQLRERCASLEAVVDSLTVPQNQSVELDALSRPVPRMNVPVRGRLEVKRKKADMDDILTTAQSRCLMLVPTLKMPEKAPSCIVRRKSKHHRRSRKTGDAPNRAVTNLGGLKRAWAKSTLRVQPISYGGDMELLLSHVARVSSST